MAIKDVYIPRKEQKESALDKILKGVQVAQGIIGTYEGVKDIQAKLEAQKSAELASSEATRREREKVLGTKDLLEAQTKGYGIEKADSKGPDVYSTSAGELVRLSPPKPKVEGISPYQQEQLKLEREKIAAELSKEAKKPSQSQTAGDKKFAADMVDWQAGGMATVDTQLKSLDDVIAQLEQSKSEAIPPTGKAAGFTPEFLKSTLMPTSKELQQQVESIVQNSLKATLGAQFTEKEASRILRNAYDPSLPVETNLRKLERLKEQMASAAAAKQAMSDYYDENGTMKGYKGPTVSIDVAKEPQPKKSGASPSPSDIQAELKRRGLVK
jgi:hypothetical protein